MDINLLKDSVFLPCHIEERLIDSVGTEWSYICTDYFEADCCIKNFCFYNFSCDPIWGLRYFVILLNIYY